MSDRLPGNAARGSSHRRWRTRAAALALLVTMAAAEPLGSVGAGAIQIVPNGAIPGDCNNDGCVTIAEILRMLRCILSPIVEPPECERCGVRAINEIIAAINSALVGCHPTPRPTRTLRPPTPTLTPFS